MKPIHTLTQLTAALLSVVVWIGCTDPVAVIPTKYEYELSITLDKESYSKSQDTRINFTLTNLSDADVYLPRIPVSIERLHNGQWENLGSWMMTTHQVGLSVRYGKGAQFKFFIETVYRHIEAGGTYRFKFDVYEDKVLRRPLPIWRRVSQPFFVSD